MRLRRMFQCLLAWACLVSPSEINGANLKLETRLEFGEGVAFHYFSKVKPEEPLTLRRQRSPRELIFEEKYPGQQRKIGVYCHGWNADSLEGAEAYGMKAALLDSNNFDAVVLVDWVEDSKEIYDVVIKKYQIVAEALSKEFLKWKTSPKNVELYGHGIGAHIVGSAAHLISLEAEARGEKVAKVVGCNPAGYHFKQEDYGLNEYVASEVVTVNTDGILGAYRDLGSNNIYVDKNNPLLEECKGPLAFKCRHSKAVDICARMVRGVELWENKTAVNFNCNENWIKALVLDVSPSMQEYGRIQSLVASVNGLISSIPLNSTPLAIIQFGGYAQMTFAPKIISSEEVRAQAIKGLLTEKTLINGTSIGSGLKAAYALATGDICVEVVLITDGEENDVPYVKDVKVPKCSRVNAIAFGEHADKKLEDLARATGGTSGFVGDIDSLKNLPGVLSDLYYQNKDENKEGGSVPIRLSKTVNSLKEDVTFNIDEDVGKDLTVSILALNDKLKGLLGQVEIEGPGGIILNGEVDKYGMKQFKFDGQAPEGEWNVKFSQILPKRKKREVKSTRSLGIIEVKSFPKEGENVQPVILEAGLSHNTMAEGEPIIIFSILRKGAKLAVLGARVKAKIYNSEDEQVAEISMFDNGLGSDKERGDGIYTRALWEGLDPHKRYQLKVTATCGEMECSIIDPAEFLFSQMEGKPQPEVTPLKYSFEREVNAGSVKYLDLEKGEDQKLTKLEEIPVTQEDYEEGRLAIILTAIFITLIIGGCVRYLYRTNETVNYLFRGKYFRERSWRNSGQY